MASQSLQGFIISNVQSYQPHGLAWVEDVNKTGVAVESLVIGGEEKEAELERVKKCSGEIRFYDKGLLIIYGQE